MTPTTRGRPRAGVDRAAEPSLDWWRRGALDARPGAAPRVLFGQVHEDADVELAALAAAPEPRRALCIASGGETAFSLLAARPARLDVVDINWAQVALVALKRSAIQQLERDTLIRCLDVDARPFYARLSPQLDSDQRAFWDARLGTLDHGLNHCGWADRRLRIAAGLFRRLLQDECAIRTMLQMTDPDAQRRFYHRRWRNRRWRLLNAVAFSRPVLALLYRRGIVRHVPPDFGRIVEGRLGRAFVGSPADENLYLWQALIGRYPPSSDRGLPAYLRIETLPEVMSQLPRLHLECAEVGEWLVRQASGTLDFAALSNVTEVTSYEYTARLGEELARVGSPGALIVVRSIFPPTPPELDPLALRLTPVPEMARQLEQQDRSIVCAFIRVFRVER